MELDTGYIESEDRPYRIGLIALAVLIAVVVALQIYGSRSSSTTSNVNDVNREAAIRAGDIAAKCAFAWNLGQMTTVALKYYKSALPWSLAYRRLGILKESYGQSGLSEFNKLDSPQATRHLSKKRVRELRREKLMWFSIFASSKISSEDARRYTKEIKALDVGPLKDVALAEIQSRAGQKQKAARILASAKTNAGLSLAVAVCLFGLLFVGAMGGLAIAIAFLAVTAPSLALQPHARLKSSALLMAFITYLAAYVWVSAAVRIISKFAGFGSPDNWSGVWYMTMVIVAAAGAFALGMRVVVGRMGQAGQDWKEIGFKTRGVGRDVVLGLAGFLSSMPLVTAAAVISYLLSITLFRRFPTPEQPFGGIISEGSAIGTILVFLAASVVAPIVEETFFRGVLYTAFRGKTGVWRSVFLSSAIFAAIHPLPGGFPIIFAFACVLALLREKSGSLLPGMVCHSVYNTVGLVLVWLVT